MESPKRHEQQRFEFLLHINGHIICQRAFGMRGYNSKVLNSLELYKMVTECTNIIEDSLSLKTRTYLWQYFDPYKPQESEDINKRSIFEKIDDFQFEIRVDNKSIVTRQFSANPYHPKVKYQVDIKEKIPELIETIKYYLTKDELDFNLI